MGRKKAPFSWWGAGRQWGDSPEPNGSEVARVGVGGQAHRLINYTGGGWGRVTQDTSFAVAR